MFVRHNTKTQISQLKSYSSYCLSTYMCNCYLFLSLSPSSLHIGGSETKNLNYVQQQIRHSIRLSPGRREDIHPVSKSNLFIYISHPQEDTPSLRTVCSPPDLVRGQTTGSLFTQKISTYNLLSLRKRKIPFTVSKRGEKNLEQPGTGFSLDLQCPSHLHIIVSFLIGCCVRFTFRYLVSLQSILNCAI